MNKIIFSIFIFFTFCCKTHAQFNKEEFDNEGVKFLQQKNLNLEFFELAFLLPELSYLIENDTTGLFEKKIRSDFNASLSEETKYINSLSLNFLISRVKAEITLKDSFPKAVTSILKNDSLTRTAPNKKYSLIYKEYIQYPEQVDDVTLITLISSEDCSVFNSIESDKLALYNFQNWLDYGFDEFRYYPGSENTIKLEINKNLSEWIIENAKCSEHPLVQKSKIMLKEVIDSY